MLRLIRSFSTLFALVPYSACGMAFVASDVVPTGSGHARLNIFPFRIDFSTSLSPSSAVLIYAVVTCRHSKNRPPSLPSPQSNLTCSELIDSLVPAKPPLQTVFLIPNPLFFCSRPTAPYPRYSRQTSPFYQGV